MITLPKISGTVSVVLSKSQRLVSRTRFILVTLALLILPCFTLMMYHDFSYPRLDLNSSDIPTIYILSNRRSGTHLTMDLIAQILPPPFRIVKTNHVYLTNSTEKDDVEQGINCRCFNFLRSTGKMIHAHRDVRDVAVSSFYYFHSFKARLIKDLNMTEYLNNKNGVLDMIIDKWVNTTAPYFAQPDVMQLYFTDSVSGFAHTYQRIATFLGYDDPKLLNIDPRKIVSVSSSVLKRGGKGDHGYKLAMSSTLQNQILQKARERHLKKRKNLVECPPQKLKPNWFSRLFEEANKSFEGGFWIGGDEKYGLFAPSYCPVLMKGSKVVLVE